MLLHSSAVDFVRAVSGIVQSWSARPRFMALAIRLSLYAVCFHLSLPHRSILLPQTTRILTRARHPENLCSYTSNHVHLDSTLGHTCDHRPYGLIAVRTIIGSHARDANHGCGYRYRRQGFSLSPDHNLAPPSAHARKRCRAFNSLRQQ